jgi:formamidopyrimidine-DNA glycosylase
MSGSLRLVAPGTPPQKHDHVDLVFDEPPRSVSATLARFGTLLWHEGEAIETHPLIAIMGIEPLTDAFQRRTGSTINPAPQHADQAPAHGQPLSSSGSATSTPPRACSAPESRRLRAANRIGRKRYEKLIPAIKQTLAESIAAGGSSVRDYVHSDGGAGCFQLSCAVYDRAGEPCPACGQPVRVIRQAGRSTFYCPRCQH